MHSATAPGDYIDKDEEDYYAFFAFDPDGIRVEVVCDRMDMDD